MTTMAKKTVTAKEGKNKNKMKEQGKRWVLFIIYLLIILDQGNDQNGDGSKGNFYNPDHVNQGGD
jgi:hypothetical protein